MPSSLLAALMTAAVLAIQSESPPLSSTDTARSKDPNKTITLSGCVSRDNATPAQFTFLDTNGGGKYRLSGVATRKYVGRMVEIVGGPVGRRLQIRGGLMPSPNAAAQAGAMDPTRAAIAGMPGGTSSGAASSQLPEFRVQRVRSLSGSCQ
jgi:hypothetical protein